MSVSRPSDSIKLEQVQRYYDALKIIAAYMDVDKLRNKSVKLYGVDYPEALEYAYENVLETAKAAIAGKKRPK